MFRSAQPAPQGSRTAVAIDEAIRQVLAERRRAREQEAREQQLDPDSTPMTDDGSPETESGAAGFESARPRTRVGRAIARTRNAAHATSERLRNVVGPPETIERGFIMSAGTIVAVLTVLRLVGQTSPFYAIGISVLVMATVLAPRLRHGIDMWRGRRMQNRPIRQMLSCVVCAPYFAWCAGPSLTRSTKAALCTSWLGVVGGTVALIAAMV